MLRILLLVSLVVALPLAAAAQDVLEDPADLARFRFGPIRFTPILEVRNVGVDTNVFNEASEPERDFTAAIGPAAEYWMRLGRARVHGRSGLHYIYFQEFENQRSIGTENEVRVDLPLNRLKPFLYGGYDNTRRRPEYEIDIRTRYETTHIGGGLDVRALSRTVFRLEAEHGRLDYDEDAFFFGTNLGEALDRRSRAYRVSVRQEVTPLTTFVVQTERQEDRFDVSHPRDADSYRVFPGFELDPRALIAGRAFVGYRSFTTLDADVPDFDGLVALVEAVYALRATRFGVAVQRDVWYSYELTAPFFVVTDVNLEVTQKVTTNWDAVGRVGRQLLDYYQRQSLGGGDRNDTLWHVGGGVGRRVGRASRIGFDVDHVRRESSQSAVFGYVGWRIGGSLTYGVQGS